MVAVGMELRPSLAPRSMQKARKSWAAVESPTKSNSVVRRVEELKASLLQSDERSSGRSAQFFGCHSKSVRGSCHGGWRRMSQLPSARHRDSISQSFREAAAQRNVRVRARSGGHSQLCGARLGAALMRTSPILSHTSRVR